MFIHMEIYPGLSLPEQKPLAPVMTGVISRWKYCSGVDQKMSKKETCGGR